MAKNTPANPTENFEPTPKGFVDHFHLTQGQLADRWSISHKTLEANRLKGVGVPWIKIGRLVRYRLSDVLAYEEAHLSQSTSSHAAQRHSSREA